VATRSVSATCVELLSGGAPPGRLARVERGALLGRQGAGAVVVVDHAVERGQHAGRDLGREEPVHLDAVRHRGEPQELRVECRLLRLGGALGIDLDPQLPRGPAHVGGRAAAGHVQQHLLAARPFDRRALRGQGAGRPAHPRGDLADRCLGDLAAQPRRTGRRVVDQCAPGADGGAGPTPGHVGLALQPLRRRHAADRAGGVELVDDRGRRHGERPNAVGRRVQRGRHLEHVVPGYRENTVASGQALQRDDRLRQRSNGSGDRRFEDTRHHRQIRTHV